MEVGHCPGEEEVPEAAAEGEEEAQPPVLVVVEVVEEAEEAEEVEEELMSSQMTKCLCLLAWSALLLVP